MNKSDKKINPMILLGTIVTASYAILMVADFNQFLKATRLFGNMLINIIPVMIVVYILMLAINYFIEPTFIKKHLGNNSGIKGLLIAIAGGILSAGSIYAWYPLLADFRRHGMSNKLIAVFLYNRAIKLPLLFMLIYYFGAAFTIIFTVFIVLFSVINGYLVEIAVPTHTNEEEPLWKNH
ncbi:MAG: hypothetical protein AB7T22_05420 [Calditrichaceae bacterium]